MKTEAAPALLPRLRQDLILSHGDAPAFGDPTWRVYDPLRHRFIAIDRATVQVFSLWDRAKSETDLADIAQKHLGRNVPAAEIEALIAFLKQNALLEPASDDTWRRQLVPPSPISGNVVMRAVHSYLFFKWPLFSPQRFLAATADAVEGLFSRIAIGIFAAIGLVGLYFVSREWSQFIDEARGMMSAAGLAQFAVTLFAVKIVHEFAHAFAAHRAGCRVPVMGVAFMMGAPVLYTDVTDAWRLARRRQRFVIDAAGVAVELYIACIATFAWVFLPDGAPRHVAFLLATTSWLMSIAVNLNPLMRFDGYYILSDVVGIENLQARAFDVAVWRLRELLFGLGAEPPERSPAGTLWFLSLYGWAVWIYRLLLFSAIALAVYAFFFKILGIALFLFEIGYFIVKPLVSEVRAWWSIRRAIIGASRSRLTAGAGLLVLGLIFLPWSKHVAVPAVLDAENTTALHVTRAARVTKLHIEQGADVTPGMLIAEFEAPELAQEILAVRGRLSAVKVRLDRASADLEDLKERIVLETTRDALVSRLAGLEREQRELRLVSPVEGIAAEIAPYLRVGRWVGVKEVVVRVRSKQGAVVRGFVSDADAWRLASGAKARFVPDTGDAWSVDMTIRSVSVAAVTFIDAPELLATHGGAIDAPLDDHRRARPSKAYFAVIAKPDHSVLTVDKRQRGILHVDGVAESFATATFRRILRVLVREAGT